MTTLTMLMVSCGQQDIDGMDAGAGWMWSAVGLHAMQYDIEALRFCFPPWCLPTTTTINVFASCFGRFTSKILSEVLRTIRTYVGIIFFEKSS